MFNRVLGAACDVWRLCSIQSDQESNEDLARTGANGSAHKPPFDPAQSGLGHKDRGEFGPKEAQHFVFAGA